nr:uncharacterized protein LOC117273022 [Nicotiana tomentosiformis]
MCELAPIFKGLLSQRELKLLCLNLMKSLSQKELKTLHLEMEGVHGVENSFRGYFVGVEDVTSLGDLDVPRKNSSEASSSFKLTNQFSAPSVDPGRKRSIIISIPKDARVLYPHVGVASYLRFLVTEEGQANMDEVEAACLFNEAQHALNQASVLHHEAFLQI